MRPSTSKTQQIFSENFKATFERKKKYPPKYNRLKERLMYVQKAGEFFKVTNGGAPMNCDNALISIEMEYITAQKNKLEKKMKESFALGKEVELAIAVMRSKRLEYNPQAQSKRAKTKFIPN